MAHCEGTVPAKILLQPLIQKLHSITRHRFMDFLFPKLVILEPSAVFIDLTVPLVMKLVLSPTQLLTQTY